MIEHGFIPINDETDMDEVIEKARFIEDGDVVIIPMNCRTAFVCCDCGLAHDMVFEVDLHDESIRYEVERNDDATVEFRRRFRDKFPLWNGKSS